MARNIIITGASSGLGKAIKEQINKLFDEKYSMRSDAWAKQRDNIYDWSTPEVDVRSFKSIKAAEMRYQDESGNEPVDVLINCAGINHIEFIPDLEEDAWDRVMDTNAKGIFLVTQALLPYLKQSGGTIINIVSNASHVPMTSSLAYNASKGAAEIMTKQMSRELIKTHGITVFGISPNKLSGTGMSNYIDNKVCELRGWTPQQAKDYQMASLPAGKETDPNTLAEFIAFLLSSKERHKYLAGCIIPYGL